MKPEPGRISVTLIFLFFLFSAVIGQPERLSVSALTETLQSGKVLRTSAEIHLDPVTGRIVTLNLAPEKFVTIVDPSGKAEMYYPATNNVLVMKNRAFSSRNNNLWYFMNPQGYDLGLQELGFRAVGNRNEDNFTVTTWQAPLKLLAEVDKVDLVHDKGIPIYLEYKNTKGQTKIKVYYDDFVRHGDISVPSRITEVQFSAGSDSTIRRTTYSAFRWGIQADTAGFNYRIPAGAVRIK